jgi:hypothetical protein
MVSGKYQKDDRSVAEAMEEAKEFLENLKLDWDEKTAREHRPLPDVLLQYACGDVIILPLIYNH